MAVCSADILFWVNVFAWTFDPRAVGTSTVLPFITYPYQDDDILATEECIEQGIDIVKVKSRDMGATWDCLLNFMHRVLFREMESFLLVSRKEEYVYKAGDHKALFSKCEFLLDRLPLWMMGGFDKSVNLVKLHLTIPGTGGTIDGEATTEDVARGDRRTAILLDEFAAVKQEDSFRVLRATRDASNCRVFNSTPKGMGNGFHEMYAKATAKGARGIRLVDMPWWMHPAKRRGLYVAADGKKRSPWYDRECRRAGSLAEIAEELDRDFLGSDRKFFAQEVIDGHAKEYAREPYLVGDLEFGDDGEPGAFERKDEGLLKLWLHLAADGRPPKDREYAVTADVSTGMGASNSTLSVVDFKTAEKVAEWACPTMKPETFGVFAVAVARWFSGAEDDGALLCWEANGPGLQFGKAVGELSYGRIYFRHNERKFTTGEESTIPGFYTSEETKRVLLGSYGRDLKEAKFVNRSRLALDECLSYVYRAGKIVNYGSTRGEDPSGARENHGDRVIADALAAKMLRERNMLKQAEESAAVPEGSFMARRQAREKAREAEDEW